MAMTASERLAQYRQSVDYQARQRRVLTYELERHYQVRLEDPTNWSFSQISVVSNAVGRLGKTLGGPEMFVKAIGPVSIAIRDDIKSGALTYGTGRIEIQEAILTGQTPSWLGEVAVVHELAHAWAFNQSPLKKLNFEVLSYQMRVFCGAEEGPTRYGRKNWLHPSEEWAESVASYVYPEYIENLIERSVNPEPQAGLGSKHREFVEEQIRKLRGEKP